MKRRLLSVGVALVLAGCSSPDSIPSGSAAPSESRAGSRSDAKRPGARSRAGTEGKRESQRKPPSGNETAAPDPGDAGGGGSGAGAAASGNGERESDGAAAYPAAGSYVFSQRGTEQFCDTSGNCDEDPLPHRQPTSVSYTSRSDDSAVVVSEVRAGRRVARTTAHFGPGNVVVTELYVRLDYGGISFERTYTPEPPVEAYRFPFRPGASWSGSWRDDTSGKYSVSVGDKRTITVGGRSVSAYPVRMRMELSGDFDGKSDATTWVDPRTRSIVATSGALNVSSAFGRYSTVFRTTLIEGPGY